MPTPFTHLKTAAQLLDDPEISQAQRMLLWGEAGAFLLGNVAADARVSSGLKREDTHFYQYDQPMVDHPWRVMLARFPALAQPTSAGQRAFAAGYVTHLTMDEVWSLDMLRPHFADREWAPQHERFLMLHVILCAMDERDYDQLPGWQREALTAAVPENWAPFMPDADLAAWRDLIAGQLPPMGTSKTLEIFGERVAQPPEALAEIVHSPVTMEMRLWQHIPRAVLAEVEETMYQRARGALVTYLDETD